MQIQDTMNLKKFVLLAQKEQAEMALYVKI